MKKSEQTLFYSDNTKAMTVEEVKAKLLEVSLVPEELESWKDERR